MSTINPLFVDSTKPIGDKVVTNVELFNVLLHDGESLFFEMTDQFDFVQRFPMKLIETKKSSKYTAEIWLKYQYEIRYRFLVIADGEEVYASPVRDVRAGHIISEKWEASFKRESISKKEKRKEPKPATAPQEIKATPAAKRLVTPHFFEQIKSVFDELL